MRAVALYDARIRTISASGTSLIAVRDTALFGVFAFGVFESQTRIFDVMGTWSILVFENVDFLQHLAILGNFWKIYPVWCLCNGDLGGNRLPPPSSFFDHRF
jgi:hypothetical protein